MSIKDTIQDIVNGTSVDDGIDALLNEKRVCTYRGPRMRRKSKRGQIYYVRERVCRGRPDPRKSQKLHRALSRGSVRQRRSRAQRARWRNPSQSKKR